MTIAIVGGGAMGCLFASHLASGGRDVWLYDIDGAHVKAIDDAGLMVSRKSGTRRVAMRATTDPNAPGVVDVVMIFVKYGSTRAAATSAAPMIGPATTVVTLQNGIGNVELIRNLYPNPLIYGLTTLTSELLGPGHIEASFDGAGETHIWHAEHTDERNLALVHEALKLGGINSLVSPDIDRRIWKKLVVNCCLNSMCAITNLPVGDLVDQPGMWSHLDALTAEICDTAIAVGVDITSAEGRSYLRDVAEQARRHVPSMLMDVRARRATEIGCLNEAVLRAAEKVGLRVPLNGLLAGLVRAIEASWQRDKEVADLVTQ